MHSRAKSAPLRHDAVRRAARPWQFFRSFAKAPGVTIRNHGTGHALASREMAILLAVADEGSIRRAAQYLGFTPAAVSKAVRVVEARLGAELFERAAGGMRPMESAEALLKAGRAALMQLSAAEAAFRSGSGRVSGPVRIGSGPFPAASIARILVPEARNRLPDVRLMVDVGTAEELLAGLQRGRFDLAVCHLEDVSPPPGFRAHVIQRLHSVVLARPGHPLAGVVALPPTRLVGCSFAGFPPYSRFLHWFRAEVGAEADFAFLGSDFDMLAEAVARSDMLLIASHSLAHTLCHSHGLVALNIRWKGFRHEVNIVQPDPPISPAAVAVAGLMDELLPQQEN